MNRDQQELYRVNWEIDIPADSSEEAVKQAVAYLAPMEPARWAYLAQNHATGEVITHEGEDLF